MKVLNSKIKDMLQEEFVEIIGLNSGKKYNFYKNMYSVLSTNLESPLSCVSVANNSISIDFYTGCSWNCSYCHVQGIYEDVSKNNLRMLTQPVKRNKFEEIEVLEALFTHPFFEKDKTIISFGTSSTEPFVVGDVLNSTIKAMRHFKTRGFKNPFWIVTKAGLSKELVSDLIEISKYNKIILSFCYANNNKNIEPIQNNRFRNINMIPKESNISLNWYLRPLVPEWFNREITLEKMFQFLKDQEGEKKIESIIVGGLRWTEGIEYGLTEIRNLEMPKLIKENNVKTFDESFFDEIKVLGKKYFPHTNVYLNSSCGLSKSLSKKNINFINHFEENNCLNSLCDENQRNICHYKKNYSIKSIQKKIDSFQLPLELRKIDFHRKKIVTNPNILTFPPAIQQITRHIIATHEED